MAKTDSPDDAGQGSDPRLAPPQTDNSPVQVKDAPDETLVEKARRLRAEAQLDPSAEKRGAADQADADLADAAAIPSWKTPSEAQSKADRIAEVVGDGMPDDASDSRWLDLVTLIGHPLSELAGFYVDERGVCWQLTSGVWYIAVGSKNPTDARGRRGIFMLTPPLQYKGPFPAYGTVSSVDPAAVASLQRPPSVRPPV